MANAPTQAERRIAVKSPLGEDVLLFRSMTTTEHVGRLFNYEMDLLSKNESIKLEDLLGKNLTVSLALPDDGKRYFNGFVSRFALVGSVGDLTLYHASVKPWLWFLERTADCRIFQEMTVPDIIKKIFKEYDFGAVEYELSGTYRTWVFCVQYRETDFNFVSRLMEQEGIYYFFKHEDGKHTLVLTDSYRGHAAIPEGEVPYYQQEGGVVKDVDYVEEWYIAQEIQPAKYTLTDYNFETPLVDIAVTKSVSPRQKEKADLEIYDHPGEYVDTGEGDTYVKTRIEECAAQSEVGRGFGNVRGMYAGGLFNLIDHPRPEQNREYLLLSCSHEMRTNEYESGSGADKGTMSYSCSFTAMDCKVQYRSPRLTPKPIIQGPQTALVVGPSGEEIYTDKYGRVKVQFHWDREGKKDENSSCWIRVSQHWAGKSWGSIHIPRMGQEVIVEFLEGDPDRPIITGRVYNADQMPPYDLPGNMTQSGVKSRSTKGGADANFNEIRMEDKKGGEQLYIHAEKDHLNITENDRKEDVGHDRALHVGHDKIEQVDANKTITVGTDHKETIGSNMTITIGSNLSETVAINYAETVGLAMELTVGAAMTETVGGAKLQTIGLNKTVTVGGDSSVSVQKEATETVKGNRTVSVGKDHKLSIDGGSTLAVGKDRSESIDAGSSTVVKEKYQLQAKKVTIEAEEEVLVKTGDASITMKKNGDINIEGKKISITGSGDVVIKGSKVTLN